MTLEPRHRPLGATPQADGSCDFLVWAPVPDEVELVIDPGARERVVALDAVGRGYRHANVSDCPPDTRYAFRLHRGEDAVDRPDPASRWQPDGVHGPSAVVAAPSPTDDRYVTPPLADQVLYELHVGTFSEAGTFDGVIDHLDDLRYLGVTAIELLPIAQFPGDRNWGYDGVLPFAVQDSYGGPAGLRRLVEAAHRSGIGVLLDVVYNHFGPEGNVLPEFGPYLTDRYDTPWGGALNVDGPGSDEVRRYVIENAVRWIRDFHLDGLRLDAVHAIPDQSATHLLAELASAVHAEADRQNRRALVIAESELNDPRLVRAPEIGGLGLDGMWTDDFHHVIHTVLTGERDAYYADYGDPADVATILRERQLFTGRWSHHRQRTHGAPARDVPHQRFVVCVQNHDQVGNRMLGDRLSTLVGYEAQKLAAALLLLAPHTPMLWMGEEHGETNPFQYFVSHSDPDLVQAVRVGRREEFAEFAWRGEAPDPQSSATFERSRIDWKRRTDARHATLLELYRTLIDTRRALPAIADPAASEPDVELHHDAAAVSWQRHTGTHRTAVAANLTGSPVDVTLHLAEGHWEVALDTADPRWDGPGGCGQRAVRSHGTVGLSLAPHSAVCLESGVR